MIAREGEQGMPIDLYWVAGNWPGKVAVASRPRGDDWLADDIANWKRAGVNVVLSLLTSEEESSLGLRGEADQVRASGLDYVAFPIPDLQVPTSSAKLSETLDKLGANLAKGENVLIHCRQGIGRSGLVAACLLISKGLSPGAAIEQVSAARGLPVPETPKQREWIDRFAIVSASAR